MPNKWEYPLIVNEALERFKYYNKEGFVQSQEENFLCIVRYPNPDPNFYFGITNAIVSTNNRVGFYIKYKPDSDVKIEESGYNGLDEEALYNIYNGWVSIVKKYEISDPFPSAGDRIEQQYKKEFFDAVEVIGDDLDTNTYPFETQIVIDNFLNVTLQKLILAKSDESIPEQEKIALEEAIEEVDVLKKSQTRLVKRKVLEGLATVYAKIKKAGLSHLKDFLTEFRKQVFSKGAKEIVDNPGQIVQTIGKLWEQASNWIDQIPG